LLGLRSAASKDRGALWASAREPRSKRRPAACRNTAEDYIAIRAAGKIGNRVSCPDFLIFGNKAGAGAVLVG
jgi:hypothetical protein